MFRWILTAWIAWFPLLLFAQKGLVLGRELALPDPGGQITVHFSDSLRPDSLPQYNFVLVFSSAHSRLSPEDVTALREFVSNGGGLYIGADNWPFFSESNQLTFAFFGKSCWENQGSDVASVSKKGASNEVLAPRKEIPAGQTTVSFPLDYRLKVEAWSGDEPLILSGNFGKGKLILDGGYSRFNTVLFHSDEAEGIFRELIAFLVR